MRALFVFTVVLTAGAGTFALLEMPLKLEHYPNQEHCLTPVRCQEPVFASFRTQLQPQPSAKL
jgi:hypothetical protein